MAERTPTLYEAVEAFMGPIVAEYGLVVESGNPEMSVIVKIGGYEIQMKLADLQRLDRAHEYAVHQKIKRAERKSRGTLL